MDLRNNVTQHVTTYPDEIGVRLRILISVAIGVATGTFCWFLLKHLHLGAADFSWSIRAARYLLSRTNPYDTPFEQYPLTAAFFGLPFLWLQPEIAAGVFFGISSAFLAFGLAGSGYWRLLVFFAYPFWAAVLTAQWSPLIMACAFFPILLPVAMVKPQIGLPVALIYPSRRGYAACAVLLLVSLVIMPTWPLMWMKQLGYYSHFIPLFVLPGPLLALALLRHRDHDARLLLLMALMPQRWFYDTLILWLIPKTRRELVWTVFASWGAGIWRWYHIPHSAAQVGRWTVLFLYLPMLVAVLSRRNPRTSREWRNSVTSQAISG